MKKNKLRDQDKNKINKINQNQIMNLLIIRTINYENKKFNNALKIEASENKNKFKFHNKNKNKNKSETKFKKLNEMSTSTSMSDNAEKKKLTYINCNYCERQHSQSCFYKHSESAEEK